MGGGFGLVVRQSVLKFVMKGCHFPKDFSELPISLYLIFSSFRKKTWQPEATEKQIGLDKFSTWVEDK